MLSVGVDEQLLTTALAAQAQQRASVDVYGFDAASERAMTLAAEQGLTFVHPFDDPDVIAGQGTVAVELLRQHEGPIDAVFVAIGGGGLVSGVAAYLKAVRPEIRVIGVQTADSDAMARSDMATAIMAESQRQGGPFAEIERVTTAAFNAPAKRPLNARLSNAKATEALGLSWTPFATALERSVAGVLKRTAS